MSLNYKIVPTYYVSYSYSGCHSCPLLVDSSFWPWWAFYQIKVSKIFWSCYNVGTVADYPLLLIPLGSASQKGTVMGILRSLGALARALGPVVSSSGEETETKGSFHSAAFLLRWCYLNYLLYIHICFVLTDLFAVYWIAGAQTCFLITSASFVLPLALLGIARRLKEEWAT